jgi:hypothetical protein
MEGKNPKGKMPGFSAEVEKGTGKLKFRVGKPIACALSGILLLFFFGGVIASATLELPGLRFLSPLLLGPGLTILGLGILYDFTIRPLASFHEKLHSMIARTYTALGALFLIMGALLWIAG